MDEDMETWTSTWNHGQGHGNMETWKHGNMEKWRHEDMSVAEDMDTWRHG